MLTALKFAPDDVASSQVLLPSSVTRTSKSESGGYSLTVPWYTTLSPLHVILSPLSTQSPLERDPVIAPIADSAEPNHPGFNINADIAASKIAINRGAKVTHAEDIEQAMGALRSGKGADMVPRPYPAARRAVALGEGGAGRRAYHRAGSS